MTVLSLLVSERVNSLPQEAMAATPNGSFAVSSYETGEFPCFRIRRAQREFRSKGEVGKALTAGITVMAASVDGNYYWSLESFSTHLRDVVAEILSVAFFGKENVLKPFGIPENKLAGFYEAAKQVLECRICVGHEELVLEDINMKEFRSFRELSRLGDVTEIVATLEPSDHVGIRLVRIIKDGRFTISPKTTHPDAFGQVLRWLQLTG